MKRFLKIAVLVGGASLLAASPVFAQDLNALNPLSGLGLDLDPFHIFTPAAPPPAAAEAPAPHRHRRLHHAAARRHAHYAGAHHAAHHVAARHIGHHVASHHTAQKAHLAKS